MKKSLFLLFLLFTFNIVFSQTVYITKTGKKYHDIDCSHLKYSSISIDLGQAIERAYEACKVCKPNKDQTANGRSNFLDKRNIETIQSSSSSTQCAGRTKKGARCKRMTTNSSGRCYQH
ncbi:hypothetical protein [Flavobacterium granuli]|uniref:Uncharacterized protein n=1 Tax=Flavobacterium granuli TaxID=280093 RepID=A0A1M5U7E6_9FLAO|nr:hypothetical protein [Flavobacterium granuli]PRZ19578.1 hypothetical protein BC624_11626 [Flavobacterium granuli]SHH58776.1 hypothetical protein SAMN05443373_11826 [Flavobacterium granuli]